ncbi:lymphoid-restricted membrane protein isoform X2 [Archocentrus centrarchus]|uniref:lymphoid-restricted membrane protein isoform X2 n=1 Tax=Archocentrus centrarchus TaxID=63155 RepID=UPI0011E9D063|nr:lymphoid-restricted membrane protein-like isoform X2 [Archocentrus centrarchus]
MSTEPGTEISSCSLPNMPNSDDSEEETSQEEPLTTSWSELPIIERVGLNSVEMSENDLEMAFSQIALSFRCDQYTLKQRLQAEEHARNLAEENVQLELSRGRETLEILKGLCLDSKRSKILQKLELSLDILGGTVERISNTAEVLGAVHQEARVSRAVELMVAHVERLKRRYDRNLTELEEARGRMQQQQQQHQNPCRNTTDPKASTEPEESENTSKDVQQPVGRRVCVSVISSQTQERKKQNSRKRLSSSRKPDPSGPSPSTNSESSCSFTTKDNSCSVEDSSPLDALLQRHKGKAVLSNKGKDKKMTNMYRQISMDRWRQPPQAHWLQRCRLVLLCTFVIFCAIALSYFLW